VTASARPAAALRPFLAEDASALAEIFRASIEELTADDYGQAQQEAWASAADDEAAFGRRLEGALTLVATSDGEPVGFASLKDGEEIDMLYVHPEAVGQGVATMLCDALEKLAHARGAKRLTAQASDTALPFFERRGFQAQRRNTVLRGGEWLATTTVEKRLAANEPGRAPQ
jgi:putative acetyltransferase